MTVQYSEISNYSGAINYRETVTVVTVNYSLSLKFSETEIRGGSELQ